MSSSNMGHIFKQMMHVSFYDVRNDVLRPTVIFVLSLTTTLRNFTTKKIFLRSSSFNGLLKLLIQYSKLIKDGRRQEEGQNDENTRQKCS